MLLVSTVSCVRPIPRHVLEPKAEHDQLEVVVDLCDSASPADAHGFTFECFGCCGCLKVPFSVSHLAF